MVVTYRLEARGTGTHLTLSHTGFVTQEICAKTCSGWETSFRRLAELLAADVPTQSRRAS
jgi:uncharacterized protein YndB with AHSA1/START domain